MTQKEKDYFEAVVAKLSAANPEKKITDVIYKIFGFVLTSLVVWIFTVVSDTQAIVQRLAIESEHTKEKLITVSEFTKQPRFSQTDFNLGIEPLRNAINANTAELNSHIEFMGKTVKDLEDLKSRMQRIEYELETVRKK